MSKHTLKTFIVDIRGGKPAFTTETQRKMFTAFLKQFEGKRVWMTIDPKLPKRSDRQNRYYWLYLGIISHETGHEVELLHQMFKEKFLFKEYKQLLDDHWRIFKSTTDLTKSEFSEYIDKIAELTGITPPDSEIFQLALTN